VRFSQHFVVLLRAYSNQQTVRDDAAEHASIAQKCEAAEHLLFGDVSPSRERSPNPVRKLVIEAH